MNGIKNLLLSEHGILGVALIAASAVLAGVGVINAQQWMDYSKWIFMGFGVTHAGVAAADAIASKGESSVSAMTMLGDLFNQLAKKDAPAAPAASPVATEVKPHA